MVKRVSWLVALAVMGSPIAASGGQHLGRGAAVYASQKCSLCHGLDGKGNQKGALDEVGSKLTAEQLRQWIVNPTEMAAKAQAVRKPAMKAYPNLPKDDLEALVAFLHAKKKK